MSQLSRNLTSLREHLGLKVKDVQEELNRMGLPVAYSTVAGWFNGSRGVRGMKNLRALCEVLQTDMNGLTGDDAEVTDGPMETMVVRDLRELSEDQQEAVLALIRTMRGAGR